MTLKVGDVLRRVTDHKTTITILDLETRDYGPLVQWAGKYNCRTRFIKDWSRSSFELIPSTPTTFEVGKKYVPSNSPARGIVTILAQLDDGDFAFSFEEYGGGISVNKLHPSCIPHYKEYIPPPPEEWRALFYRENGKPEVSAQHWPTKEAVEGNFKCTSGGKNSFMYAIRTDINAKKEN